MEKKPTLTDQPLDEVLPDFGVVVLESHHSPQFSMQWRRHPFVKLVYVLRGEGRFDVGKRSVSFTQADTILVPPETPNRIVDAKDAASSLYVCCVAVELFSFDSLFVDRLRAGRVAPDPSTATRIATQLRRMRHIQLGHGENIALDMVSGAMRLMQLVRSTPKPQRRIPNEDHPTDRQRVAAYVERLETNFFEATTIDEAAAELNLSRRHFTNLFTETAGETWLHRVRRLAITHAQSLLRHSNSSIPSIAFECGFNDLSTFYRQFKSHTGESPKAYRLQCSGDVPTKTKK